MPNAIQRQLDGRFDTSRAGEEGPEAYDQRTLHFTRVGVREFNLSIGTPVEVRKWKRRSTTIDGSYKMKSGRQWGVY